MELDGFFTISQIARELGSTHNTAWRFARAELGAGLRLGNQRLYERSRAARAIALRRRRLQVA